MSVFGRLTIRLIIRSGVSLDRISGWEFANSPNVNATPAKGAVMTAKNALLIMVLFLMVGCAQNVIVNVDGMPVADKEYTLINSETGIRTVFVLVRSHRVYENKNEYIVKPDYLDVMVENKIEKEKTEALRLHLKVINLKKSRYSINWEISGPNNLLAKGLLYSGKLSRKDFALDLPINKAGKYEYLFRVIDGKGNDLYELPRMRYIVEGGDAVRVN
jgi:hypothetical protein